MQFKWGEDFDGPGRADPSKSRDERLRELRALLRTEDGRDIVFYHFAKYTGVLGGAMGPIGAPMIQTILEHEYPNG